MIDPKVQRAHKAGIPVDMVFPIGGRTILASWRPGFVYDEACEFRIAPGIEVRLAGGEWRSLGQVNFDAPDEYVYEWRSVDPKPAEPAPSAAAALLPCPFCGSDGYLNFFGVDRSRAKCLNSECGAELSAHDKRVARERWNRRALAGAKHD